MRSWTKTLNRSIKYTFISVNYLLITFRDNKVVKILTVTVLQLKRFLKCTIKKANEVISENNPEMVWWTQIPSILGFILQVSNNWFNNDRTPLPEMNKEDFEWVPSQFIFWMVSVKAYNYLFLLIKWIFRFLILFLEFCRDLTYNRRKE